MESINIIVLLVIPTLIVCFVYYLNLLYFV